MSKRHLRYMNHMAVTVGAVKTNETTNIAERCDENEGAGSKWWVLTDV